MSRPLSRIACLALGGFVAAASGAACFATIDDSLLEPASRDAEGGASSGGDGSSGSSSGSTSGSPEGGAPLPDGGANLVGNADAASCSGITACDRVDGGYGCCSCPVGADGNLDAGVTTVCEGAQACTQCAYSILFTCDEKHDCPDDTGYGTCCLVGGIASAAVAATCLPSTKQCLSPLCLTDDDCPSLSPCKPKDCGGTMIRTCGDAVPAECPVH
jgi:hypothetical protein